MKKPKLDRLLPIGMRCVCTKSGNIVRIISEPWHHEIYGWLYETERVNKEKKLVSSSKALIPEEECSWLKDEQ
jgi:hypothetical protein